MKFDNMDKAIEYIKSTLGIIELQYESGSYSYGQKDDIRLIAEYNNHYIEVKSETWAPEESDEMKMIEADNTQLSKMAFFKLYSEKKADAALRWKILF